MMNSLPKRGQRTATNKASKAKMAMPAKANKMPPGLLMSMKAKSMK